MSKVFQIQTPNSSNYLSDYKVHNLTAPIPNKLGPEVIIKEATINLTSNMSVVLISGVVPVTVNPINFSKPGTIDLIINVYNYTESSNPLYTKQYTILFMTNPGLSSFVNIAPQFQFVDTTQSIEISNVTTYTITSQIISSIKITNNEVMINAPTPNLGFTDYFSILLQQIS